MTPTEPYLGLMPIPRSFETTPGARAATLAAVAGVFALASPVASASASAEFGAASALPRGGGFYSLFRDLAAINAHLDEVLEVSPDLTEPLEIGASLEGRPLRGLTIGHPETEAATLLLTSTMHADEWLATTTVLCIADALVQGYGRDPEITAALDRVQVVVLPMLNPDGYVHTWEVDRYWRGNRRLPGGVNLNRNFPTGWTQSPSGAFGESPLSEPETYYLAEWMRSRPDIVAHVDYHANGQDILYPWAHLEEATADAGLFEELAAMQSEAIEMVHGVVYEPAQTWELAPGAGGIVLDWAYDELGILAFTPEVRPGNEGSGGHVVGPELIVPTCEENLAGTLALLNWVVGQTPEPELPEGTSGGVSTGEANPSGTDGASGSDSSNSGATSASEDSTGDADGGESGGSTTQALGGEGAESGCTCRTSSAPWSGAWLLALVVGATRRRR